MSTIHSTISNMTAGPTECSKINASDSFVPRRNRGVGPSAEAGPARSKGTLTDCQPLDDWNLLVGRRIEIYLNDHLVRVGVVDDAMPDSSILWLAAEGNHPRELFEWAEGYVARPSFQASLALV
ncbi:hypothetical protein [Arthrobacter sp. S2(2024)]|uniref:hypothetical protein n=1 Tax=Arthrobacter sp. S2(2024) TaxID=3111911 RepID=UPI002FC77278